MAYQIKHPQQSLLLNPMSSSGSNNNSQFSKTPQKQIRNDGPYSSSRPLQQFQSQQQIKRSFIQTQKPFQQGDTTTSSNHSIDLQQKSQTRSNSSQYLSKRLINSHTSSEQCFKENQPPLVAASVLFSSNGQQQQQQQQSSGTFSNQLAFQGIKSCTSLTNSKLKIGSMTTFMKDSSILNSNFADQLQQQQFSVQIGSAQSSEQIQNNHNTRSHQQAIGNLNTTQSLATPIKTSNFNPSNKFNNTPGCTQTSYIFLGAQMKGSQDASLERRNTKGSHSSFTSMSQSDCPAQQIGKQLLVSKESNCETKDDRIFKVLLEIGNQNEEQRKVKELLLELMRKTREAQRTTSTSIQLLGERKQILEEFYAEEGRKLELFAAEFARLFELATRECVGQLEKARAEGLEQLRRAEGSMNVQLSDLDNIKTDIGDNIHNIFTNLSFKPFSSIFNKYSERVEGYQENSQKVSQIQLNQLALNQPALTELLSLLAEKSTAAFTLKQSNKVIEEYLKGIQQSIEPVCDLVITNPRFGGQIQCPSSSMSSAAHGVSASTITPYQSVENMKVTEIGLEKEKQLPDTPKELSPSELRQKSRDNQVYISFNNKTIFANEQSSSFCNTQSSQQKQSSPSRRIETLGGEQDNLQYILQPTPCNDTVEWKDSSTDAADVERRDLRRTLQETRETERAFDSVAERNLLGSRRSGRATSATASSKESEDQEQVNQLQSIEGGQGYQGQAKCAQPAQGQTQSERNGNFVQDKLVSPQKKLNEQHVQARMDSKSPNNIKSPNSIKYLELIDKINTNQLHTNQYYHTLIAKEQPNSISDIPKNMPSSLQQPINTSTFAVQLQKISSIDSSKLLPGKNILGANQTSIETKLKGSENQPPASSPSPYFTNQAYSSSSAANYPLSSSRGNKSASSIHPQNFSYQKKLF